MNFDGSDGGVRGNVKCILFWVNSVFQFQPVINQTSNHIVSHIHIHMLANQISGMVMSIICDLYCVATFPRMYSIINGVQFKQFFSPGKYALEKA